jgi:hypothetical protein
VRRPSDHPPLPTGPDRPLAPKASGSGWRCEFEIFETDESEKDDDYLSVRRLRDVTATTTSQVRLVYADEIAL